MYEDNVSGKIDDARFKKMSSRYEEEQEEIARKIKLLRKAMKDADTEQMDVQRFLDAIHRYTDATQITRRMVAELIDHIDVYHQEKKGGVTSQRLTIYYNCIGAFVPPARQDVPEPSVFMETRKGVALHYVPSPVGA